MKRMIPLVGLLMVGHYSEELIRLATEHVLPMLSASGGLNVEKLDSAAKLVMQGSSVAFLIMTVLAVINLMLIAQRVEMPNTITNPEAEAKADALLAKIWAASAVAAAASTGLWVILP